MAPVRQAGDVQLQEEIALYNTLCLLDAQNADGGRLIDFSRNMFRKPYGKALELILVHSYSVIHGKAAAKKYFKGTWPLIDKDRKQSNEFYQKAFDWLKESGHLEGHGHSLKPFQRNPSGPKTVSFLVDLTFAALQAQHNKHFTEDIVAQADIQDEQLLITLSEPLMTASRAQNQLQVQRLLGNCQQGCQLQQQAEQAAAKMRDAYYSLAAQLQEARASLDELSQQHEVECYEPTPASSAGGGQQQLPLHLQAQQQELQQLWQQLDQHMQDVAGLAGLIEGMSGADIHPHAIDGITLRECGQLPGMPSAAVLDVSAMLEAWLVDVGTVCKYIKQLAGSGHQQTGRPSTARPGAVSSMTPLVATSDAASHAPHLYAQLGLHQQCYDKMRGMAAAVGVQMAATAELIEQLETEVFSRMEAEEQRVLAAMAAAEAASKLQPHQLDPFAAVGGDSSAANPTAGMHGAIRASLFKNGSLPLVPPTPMLQQLVHKKQTASTPQQQQQSTHKEPASTTLPQCKASSSQPPTMLAEWQSPHNCMQQQASREVWDEGCHFSAATSVSSAALPAADLLMSQELMDVDLVDLDGGDSADEELLHTGSLHLHGLDDDNPLRVSMVGLPIGSIAGAGHAGSKAADGVQEAANSTGSVSHREEGEDTSRKSSSGGVELVSSTARQRSSSGADKRDDAGVDTPPYAGRSAAPALPVAVAATATVMSMDTRLVAGAAAATSMSEKLETKSSQNGSSHSNEGHHTAVDDQQSTEAPMTAAGTADSYSQDSSPLVVEPVGHPMVPMTLPGMDCLSSARPRRLTYAAAALSGESGGSALPSAQHLSSDSSSGCSDVECDSAAVKQQKQQQQVGSDMSLLRQRFARAMQ